jgi:hypothetical protein
MGWEVEFTGGPYGDHGHHLGSSLGYSMLSDWFESLDPERYASLHELSREGTYTNTARLDRELEDALKNHPPADDDIHEMAYHLLLNIGGGDENETISIVM